MPQQLAFKFADWNVEGVVAIWERANNSAPLRQLLADNDRLIFSGRNNAGDCWFVLAMTCPYIAEATGDPRNVPFGVAGQFTQESPKEIFESLRREAHCWLKEHVAPTIKSVLRLEAFTKWLSWMSQQELDDASIIRDVIIVRDHASAGSTHLVRSSVTWVGFVAALGVAFGAASLLWLTKLPPPIVSSDQGCLNELRSTLNAKQDQEAQNIETIKNALEAIRKQLTQTQATALLLTKRNEGDGTGRHSAVIASSVSQKAINEEVIALTAAISDFANSGVGLNGQPGKSQPPSPACAAGSSK